MVSAKNQHYSNLVPSNVVMFDCNNEMLTDIILAWRYEIDDGTVQRILSPIPNWDRIPCAKPFTRWES
jgi:hypothetical protein